MSSNQSLGTDTEMFGKICEVLQTMRQLHYLYMNDCSLEDDCFVQLRDIIKDTPTLKFFYIRLNKLSEWQKEELRNVKHKQSMSLRVEVE